MISAFHGTSLGLHNPGYQPTELEMGVSGGGARGEINAPTAPVGGVLLGGAYFALCLLGVLYGADCALCEGMTLIVAYHRYPVHVHAQAPGCPPKPMSPPPGQYPLLPWQQPTPSPVLHLSHGVSRPRERPLHIPLPSLRAPLAPGALDQGGPGAQVPTLNTSSPI